MRWPRRSPSSAGQAVFQPAANGRLGAEHPSCPLRKVPDLLIAAAAESLGLTVLHYDADFDRIAAVTGQSCEWVVPAGTVD